MSGGGLQDDEAGERRGRPQLRALFDAAFPLIEALCNPACGWGGRSLEHLAYRVVRDNFSELSSDEVRLLVAAAHRAFIDRNPESSAHLSRPADLRPWPALKR